MSGFEPSDAVMQTKAQKSDTARLTVTLLPLVLVVLVLAMVGGCEQIPFTEGVTPSSAVPDFVQVGKTYYFTGQLGATEAKVLEIRPDGWVRVQTLDWDEIWWFNISHVSAIKPLSQ
jgi:hypothetical protein